MMRGIEYLSGIALIVVGLADAFARLTIDGMFLLTAGVGFGLVLVAKFSEVNA